MMKTKSLFCYLIGLLALLPAGCSDEDAPVSTPPTLISEEAADITRTTATLSGSIQAATGISIKEFGLEYSTVSAMPYENCEHILLNYTSSKQRYTVSLNELTPNTTYYYRFYATNGYNMTYSSGSWTFKTKSVGEPVLENPTMIQNGKQVTLKSRVTDEGGSNVVTFGFHIEEWNQITFENISEDHPVQYPDESGYFSYTFEIKNNTEYNIYAYATNGGRFTGYSQYLTIKENRYTAPQMDFFPDIISTSEESIEIKAQIIDFGTSAGREAITAIGFAYKEYDWETGEGVEKEAPADISELAEDGTFQITLTGLKPRTEYMIRAYAENDEESGGGRTYTEYTSVTTNTPETPKLTLTVDGTTHNSITVSAELTNTNDLSANLSEIGFYVRENHGIEKKYQVDLQTLQNGKFSTVITGLEQNTNYYVAAYAVNKGVVEGRSTDTYISTERFEIPKLYVRVTDTTDSSISLEGTISDTGNSEIKSIGFTYKNTAGTEQQVTVDINELTGNAFKCSISGLSPNTDYQVRAYAMNDAGTGYSEYVSCKTSNLISPTLSLNKAENVTGNSATLNAVIQSFGDEGATITGAGFCWSKTNRNPTLEDNNKAAEVTGKAFTLTVTGLEAETTYYVRAYATNESATGYSNVITVTTTGSGIPNDDDNPSPDYE